MNIQLFREDDGTFGAKIVVGEEVVFAQGDTMELLRADMRGGLACVL